MNVYIPDEIVEAWNKVGSYFQRLAVPSQPPLEGTANTTNTKGTELPSTLNVDGTWSAPEPEPITLAHEETGKAVTDVPGVELSPTASGGVSPATHSELQNQVDTLASKVEAQDSKLDAILSKLGG